MIHELKTWPDYFQAIWNWTKKFEMRRNDKDFKVGDHLLLKEFDPETGYTGREMKAKVTYIATDFPEAFGFDMEDEYCIMSINVFWKNSDDRIEEEILESYG